ncbi:MAG: PAS domain S-box protein [Candidatus Dadabacteria bacterium]|nr:PAS domain S-box protein [Candidatus Dadabacteria bacterium]
MGKSRILLVDDDQNTTEYIQVTLEMIGYDVSSTASTGAEAVQKAKENKPDLVLIDIALQGEMDGVETAQEINSNLHTPIVYLTDTVNEEVLKRANQTNPYGYVPKPIEAREVRSIIEMALFRHGMETKVKEKERWFSTTLNCIGEGIVTTNTKGNISYMNPVAEKLTGWKHNEAIGTELESVFNLISEETGDKVELPLTKVITEGFVLSSSSINIAVKSKEGNTYPIEYTASPIIDDKGRTLGGVITFRDITEKKKVEKAEELRRSEEHFRTLIDNASDLITIIDKDGIIHYQSPSVARILGYSAEESAGTNVIELIHPEDSAKFASMISKLQNTDSTYSMEYRFLHKNQSWRIMEGIGKKLPGSPNEVKIVVNSRDITERKRMEVELAAEKERLSITLRSIGDGVITVDTDGKVVMINKFAEEFIGWQDQAAFGRPLREIFRLLNEKTREECESPALSALETGETTGLKKDTVLITKDGLEKFVSASFAPI